MLWDAPTSNVDVAATLLGLLGLSRSLLCAGECDTKPCDDGLDLSSQLRNCANARIAGAGLVVPHACLAPDTALDRRVTSVQHHRVTSVQHLSFVLFSQDRWKVDCICFTPYGFDPGRYTGRCHLKNESPPLGWSLPPGGAWAWGHHADRNTQLELESLCRSHARVLVARATPRETESACP